MDIGYARVSTGEQTLDLQLDALTTAGCGKVYQETASGAKADRPVLEDVLAYLRAGDTLVVWRLDRLGRSLQHLIEVVAAAGGAGDRLQEPDRADRHHHAGRQAHLPRLRRAGRVRARPDPGADACGAGRGAGAGTTWAAGRRSWPMPSSSSWRGPSMPAGRPISPPSARRSASRAPRSTAYLKEHVVEPCARHSGRVTNRSTLPFSAEHTMLGPTKPRRLDEPIAVSLEDLVPRTNFYRHLEANLDLGFVRDWARELLRRARPAQHRPRRLLQAPAHHVLRGDPLRAPAHRDRQSQSGPPLVPRLRPRRGPPRPLQPDPDPATPGHRHLPALLRADRRPLPGGRPGLGPGALLRRHQGRRPTPPSIRSSPASITRPRPTSPTSSPTMLRTDAARLSRAATATPCLPGSSGCRSRRAPRTDAAEAIRRGGCSRSGGWTRTGQHRSYQRTTDFRVSPTDPDATPMRTRRGTALGLPRPLRRRWRQAPHHPRRPRHAGRRHGERAAAGPAVARLLPAQALARTT